MEYEQYIKMGLEGEAPLKLILCGNVEASEEGNTGVVAVVYASTDKIQTEKVLRELITKTSHTKMGLRTLKIQYYINKFMPLMQKVPKLSAGIRAAC